MSEKDTMLAAIFGDRYTSAMPKENSPKMTEMSHMSTGYQSLKEKMAAIEKKSGQKNTPSELYQWMEEGKPVAINLMSNDIEPDMSDELRRNSMSFARIKRTNNTLFIVKDTDKKRYTDILTNVRYRLCVPTKILSYDNFSNYCNENDVHPFYLNGMTELQMESLRRCIDLHQREKQYTFFRTSDGKYGMGFDAEDMVGMYPSDSPDAFKRCFLESYLASAMLMSGEQAAFYQQLLTNDVATDKQAAFFFADAIEQNEFKPIYVFNPAFPEKALYMCSGEFRRARAIKTDGYWDIETGKPVNLSDAKGIKLYRKILLEMTHKDIVQSRTDYLRKINNWFNGEKNRTAREEEKIAGKKLIANILHEHFVYTHEDESWVKDPIKVEQQLSHFKEDIVPILENFENGQIPSRMDYNDANAVLGIVGRCSIMPDTFRMAKNQVEDLTIYKDLTQEMSIQSAVSFRKQLTMLSQNRDMGVAK